MARLDIDLAETWRNIRQSNPYYYLAAFVIYYLTFPLRGFRWKTLLNNARVSTKRATLLPSFLGMGEIILLGWFVNCLVPAKLGDAYRAYLLKKNAKVSFSRTMGTVVAERIIDMLVLFALLAGAALSLVGGTTSGTALGLVELGLGLVVIIVFGLVALSRFGHIVQRFLPQRLQSKFLHLQEGTLQSFKRLPLLVGVTVVIWLFEAARLYLVTYSLGTPISIPMVLFVALASSLLTTVPFTPGGLGLVEAGITGVLAITMSKESAISVAVLDRTISYWSLIVFGLIFFLLGKKR